jgi:hypothetical protein
MDTVHYSSLPEGRLGTSNTKTQNVDIRKSIDLQKKHENTWLKWK